MVSRFCKCQDKCTEDTEDTWTCLAHLDSGRAFECPYSKDNILNYVENDKNGKLQQKKIMTFRGLWDGRCVDWKEVTIEPTVLPTELFEIEEE